MGSEIELKFELPAHGLDALARLRLAGGADRAHAARQRLVSVYFDTPGFKLRRRGITLRVRHAGNRRVQTIKTNGRGAGLFRRQEWESEIASDQPDFNAARGTALEPVLSGRIRRSLQPVFETRVQRTVVPLDAAGGRIELTLDRGTIRTGWKSAPISEIELELKAGDCAALFEVAEDLVKLAPARLAVSSKADRGYALARGEPDHATGAEPVALERGMSAEAAFRAIGLGCLRQLAANEAPVCRAEPEAVHRVRVTLRRLRAAMSLFSDLVRDEEIDRIRSELKWIAGELAPARDLDVFVAQDVAPLRDAGSVQAGLDAVWADLELQREQAFGRARQAVQSPRYRTAVLRTLRWLHAGPWTRSAGKPSRARRERPIEVAAVEILATRSRKIRKRAGRLAALDAAQRHKLRIAVKKLRYASEFFESLFPGRKAVKRCAAFTAGLKKLQKHLGRLNDIAVHEKLAARLVHDEPRTGATRKTRERAFAIGIIAGREQSGIKPALAAASKAASRFRRVRAFWT